mmetsp:Transcript_107316/g.301975  ORF Transcript_107316/g.301975 Transcript_107316/m.301975 type:complete len:233 (-) Transcript_107316:374-1072(-)
MESEACAEALSGDGTAPKPARRSRACAGALSCDETVAPPAKRSSVRAGTFSGDEDARPPARRSRARAGASGAPKPASLSRARAGDAFGGTRICFSCSGKPSGGNTDALSKRATPVSLSTGSNASPHCCNELGFCQSRSEFSHKCKPRQLSSLSLPGDVSSAESSKPSCCRIQKPAELAWTLSHAYPRRAFKTRWSTSEHDLVDWSAACSSGDSTPTLAPPSAGKPPSKKPSK